MAYNSVVEEKSAPLPLDVLSARLKKVASLCLSLSIELTKHIEYCNSLNEEIKQLKAELKLKYKKRNITPEDRERRRQAMLAYHAMKKHGQST